MHVHVSDFNKCLQLFLFSAVKLVYAVCVYCCLKTCLLINYYLPWQKGDVFPKVQVFHFQPWKSSAIISVIYPDGKSDENLGIFHSRVHKILFESNLIKEIQIHPSKYCICLLKKVRIFMYMYHTCLSFPFCYFHRK